MMAVDAYSGLVSVTQNQKLQTPGILSKAINHAFDKTLLVFADFFSERTSYINRTSTPVY